MYRKLQTRNDPEVVSGTAKSPEEVWMVLRIDVNGRPIREHDVGREDVISYEPIETLEPAVAAAECGTGDPDTAADAVRCERVSLA